MAQPALGEQRMTAREGSFKPLGFVTIGDELPGLEMLHAIRRRAAAWGLREHEHFEAQRISEARELTDNIVAVVATFPTSTWCRLRHQNPKGPSPVRNKAFLWGLPWPSKQERLQVEAENDALRSSLRLLNQMHASMPPANLVTVASRRSRHS